MTTAKQETVVIPDAFISPDECARYIEAALEALDPPLDVFGGILILIAEFAQPHGELPGGGLVIAAASF